MPDPPEQFPALAAARAARQLLFDAALTYTVSQAAGPPGRRALERAYQEWQRAEAALDLVLADRVKIQHAPALGSAAPPVEPSRSVYGQKVHPQNTAPPDAVQLERADKGGFRTYASRDPAQILAHYPGGPPPRPPKPRPPVDLPQPLLGQGGKSRAGKMMIHALTGQRVRLTGHMLRRPEGLFYTGQLEDELDGLGRPFYRLLPTRHLKELDGDGAPKARKGKKRK